MFQTVVGNCKTIRPFLAGVFLVLFALAITPRIVIHALVAHHTDTHPRLHVHGDQLNPAGFHCQLDNLVVEFPFLPSMPVPGLTMAPSGAVHPTAALEEAPTASHPLYGLRGPPAALNARS